MKFLTLILWQKGTHEPHQHLRLTEINLCLYDNRPRSVRSSVRPSDYPLVRSSVRVNAPSLRVTDSRGSKQICLKTFILMTGGYQNLTFAG